MKYVKYHTFGNVNTVQTACIELPAPPNAATEGMVGLLAIDTSSPTHDVYKCVAVNGAVYTWELLSSGMSILSSSETGEALDTATFKYEDIRKTESYIVKIGDLILDSLGYLYRIIKLGNTSCTAKYCNLWVNGANGITISKIEQTKTSVAPEGENEITVTLSNGHKHSFKTLNGANGQDGVGIASAEVNSKGELVLTYTNSKTANLGNVKGISPHIGENGNWFIANTDTGVKARGDDYILTDADINLIISKINTQAGGGVSSVDEETFIFKENLTTNFEIGNISLTNGQATIAAKGQSFKTVWESIFHKLIEPSVTYPTFTFTSSSGSGEVGTTYSLPSATFKVTSVGTYSYNNTGITFSGTLEGGSKSDTFDELGLNAVRTITYNDGGTASYVDGDTLYTFTGTYSYTDGATPNNNQGKESSSVSAISGVSNRSMSTTSRYTGWRRMFVGCLTSLPESFTSANVRSLNTLTDSGGNAGVEATRTNTYFTVPAGTKHVIVAYPASLTGYTSVRPTFSYEAMGETFYETTTVKKIQEVSVADATGTDNYTTYYIYIFTHASTSGFSSNVRWAVEI